jgi:hypothetical protein
MEKNENNENDEKGNKYYKLGFWITIIFLIFLCIKLFF